MILVENSPVDTTRLFRLFHEKDDLFLIYPKARLPFDHSQWRSLLDPTTAGVVAKITRTPRSEPEAVGGSDWLIRLADHRKTKPWKICSDAFISALNFR